MSTDLYPFHSDFAQIILYHAAASRQFWKSVGSSLEHELFTDPLAKPILTCVTLIVNDTGSHPNSLVIVIQRLKSFVAAGKLLQSTLDAVCDLFDSWVDDIPDVEVVIKEALPHVSHRINQRAILKAMDAYARKGDQAEAMALFDKAHRLGETSSDGDRFTVGTRSFADIAAAGNIARLPLGIMSLDVALNGGLERGGLGVFLGGPGGGKSICLNHGACESMRNGLFCGYVTLELPPRMVLSRMMANLVNIPTDQIYLNDNWRAEAERRYTTISHLLGVCSLVEFAPHATTVQQIIDWIDSEEQAAGQKMEALYIDYADKLHAQGVRADNDYLAMRYVYEALRRDVAVARNMWVWTASQVSRHTKDQGKRIDLNHVADSMHKVRVADQVISLNNDDITRMLTYFVAKNRTGRSRFDVGPLPTGFDVGRACFIASELGAW